MEKEIKKYNFDFLITLSKLMAMALFGVNFVSVILTCYYAYMYKSTMLAMVCTFLINKSLFGIMSSLYVFFLLGVVEVIVHFRQIKLMATSIWNHYNKMEKNKEPSDILKLYENIHTQYNNIKNDIFNNKYYMDMLKYGDTIYKYVNNDKFLSLLQSMNNMVKYMYDTLNKVICELPYVQEYMEKFKEQYSDIQPMLQQNQMQQQMLQQPMQPQMLFGDMNMMFPPPPNIDRTHRPSPEQMMSELNDIMGMMGQLSTMNNKLHAFGTNLNNIENKQHNMH